MLSTSQGPVGCLTTFNKLVDVENKRANRNEFNFTANVPAGNNPTLPWEKPTARNFTARRRGSIRAVKAGCVGFSPPCLWGLCSSRTVTAIKGGGANR